MNYWNFRRMRIGDKIALVEVYYNDLDEIEGWTEPVIQSGENDQELLNELNHMIKAFEKPLLIESEIEVAPDERNSLVLKKEDIKNLVPLNLLMNFNKEVESKDL